MEAEETACARGWRCEHAGYRGDMADWCYWTVALVLADRAKALTAITKHWDLALLAKGFK